METIKHFFKLLFHIHEYEVRDHYKFEMENNWNGKINGIQHVYINRCKVCGKLKCKKFINRPWD